MMEGYVKKMERYFIECTVTEYKISSTEDKTTLFLFKVKGVKGFLNQDIKESKEFNVFFPYDIGTKAGESNPVALSAIVLDTNTSITIDAIDANILQILASSISQGRKIKLEFDTCENKDGYFNLDNCDITIY